MRTDVVVVLTPGFDDDTGLGTAAKPLQRQALVAEFAIEALVVGILPWLARVDQRRLDVLLGEPLQNRVADELGSIVRAQIARARYRWPAR